MLKDFSVTEAVSEASLQPGDLQGRAGKLPSYHQNTKENMSIFNDSFYLNEMQ